MGVTVRDTAFDLWQLGHPPQRVTQERATPKSLLPDPGWMKNQHVLTPHFRKEDNLTTACVLRDYRGDVKLA